ncbi:MAG: hypothetical protein AAF658_11150, partial [Myxococcota bacterium]
MVNGVLIAAQLLAADAPLSGNDTSLRLRSDEANRVLISLAADADVMLAEPEHTQDDLRGALARALSAFGEDPERAVAMLR